MLDTSFQVSQPGPKQPHLAQKASLSRGHTPSSAPHLFLVTEAPVTLMWLCPVRHLLSDPRSWL